MAFFLRFSSSVSSGIAKRLLLFALSRLDILDKDPSDFVDVVVGKKSTLELRDVGLRVKRLSTLLHLELPPQLELREARVSLLRLTLSLDPQSAGVLIEVHGVQILASLSTGGVDDNQDQAPLHPNLSSNRRGRRRSPPPSSHRYNHTSLDEEGHIPTAGDLAKSFLEEEPEEERQELEAALHDQSQHLQESTYSEADSEDESGLGIGTNPSLPGFLENFIKAALDRSEVVVQQINIQLDSNTDALAPNPTDSPVQTNSTSINFRIDRASIDGLASTDPQAAFEGSSATPENSIRDGKRRISLRGLCARIICEPEQFASLSSVSRSSSPTDIRTVSPVAPRSSSKNTQAQESVDSSQIPPQEPESSSQAISTTLTAPILGSPESGCSVHGASNIEQLESNISATHSSIQSDPLNHSITSSANIADDVRFEDAPPEETQEDEPRYSDETFANSSGPSLSGSNINQSDSLFEDRGFLDYALEQGLFESGLLDEGHSGNSPSTLISKSRHSASSAKESPPYHISRSLDIQAPIEKSPPIDLLATSNVILDIPTISRSGSAMNVSTSNHPDRIDNKASAIGAAMSDPVNVETSPLVNPIPIPSLDDLSESRLFSHEEAESMYMSALSEANDSQSGSAKLPGGWGTASNSSSSTIPDKLSQDRGKIKTTAHTEKPEVEDGIETPRPGSCPSTRNSHNSINSLAGSRPIVASNEQSKLTETRVSKPLLSIDEISVWFPWPLFGKQDRLDGVREDPIHNQQPLKSDFLRESTTHHDIPGSFSLYASMTEERGPSKLRSRLNTSNTPSTEQREIPNEGSKARSCFGLEVEVGIVLIHADTSSSRLLYQLSQQISSIFQSPHKDTPAKKQSGSEQELRGSDIFHKVAVKEIHLMGLEFLGEEQFGRLSWNSSVKSLDDDPKTIIFRIRLQQLRASVKQQSDTMHASLTISRCTIGLADSNIISFDGRTRMRTSVRDLRENLKDDINLDLTIGKQKSELNIRTLPVVVSLDLQKLDDSLSCFGGFSGILELSSSISSTNALQTLSSIENQRPRGVHFEHLSNPKFEEPQSGLKVNARFGGAYVTLVGKTCGVHLHTSAIRVVARDRIIGVGIDEIRLSGPHFPSQGDEPALQAVLQKTRLEYLYIPTEKDLSRLLSLITPSKDKYEDDDILVDTLLRQRKKGSVLRASLPVVRIEICKMDQLQRLSLLGQELARFSSVAKYLPEDDRPGIMVLSCIDNLNISVMVNERIGSLHVNCEGFQVAHVGLPPLLALEIGKIRAHRGHNETLITDVVPSEVLDQLPMVTARMISDEMEPTIKLKLFNVALEYHLPTVMAVLGLREDGTTAEDLAAGIASSVATIVGRESPKPLTRQASNASNGSESSFKALKIDVLLRDCALGLNPRGLPSKSLFIFTNTRLTGALPRDGQVSATLEIRKGSLLLIDDKANFVDADDSEPISRQSLPLSGSVQVSYLCRKGYVSLSTISAAKAVISIDESEQAVKAMNVEFKDELLVLESCSDSTQTLIALLNGLKPPTPPSAAIQYRTKVMPVEDMMASFSGDAFVAEDEFTNVQSHNTMTDPMEDSFSAEGIEPSESLLLASSGSSSDPLGVSVISTAPRSLDPSITETSPPMGNKGKQLAKTPEAEELEFDDNYFGADSEAKGIAKKWDSTENKYGLDNEFQTSDSPLKVRIRDMHIIWNLYDGYDWGHTRDAIAKAVQQVEDRAEERRNRRATNELDPDDNVVIEEDFLFNSIWISIPVNEEKDAIRRHINHEIDDQVSETGSYATSTATRTTLRPHRQGTRTRRLKLQRSKHHKIQFELRGVSADIVVFPPNSGETQSSIDVRVRDLDIFDNVPSSTWRKFATYMHDSGERQTGRPMLHLEILVVRPVFELAASELVLKVSVLPLRLHVDQDALDFITRFFEFKDDRDEPVDVPAEKPFLQRVEVNTVHLKLDYKPKKVNYAGLRSGHTKEFMNFFILDGADIILKHILLFGISGFDRLNTMLNDIWIPDVTSNQLPGIIASLAAVKSLANVGSGVRDLVVIPIEEYKKDGRIIRSIRKGATSFAKTTTSELARLGAKVAIGTQTYLQGAEQFLSPAESKAGASHSDGGWEDLAQPGSPGIEEPKAISNYADQPIGVLAGLRGAARGLERDLMTVKDVIIAIPGEVMESESATGAALAVAKRAPTIILRPAVGATKAIGTALLGVGNAIDKDSRRKIEDKYKRY